MASITTKQRKKLPAQTFAGPDRTYPDDTKGRARDALARVSANGSGAVQSEVRNAVARKYPSIKVAGVGKKKMRTGK